MVVAEHEASTLDKDQVTSLTQREHSGYCYFLLQENPQIATQSGSIFRTRNLEDYIIHITNDEMGRIISSTTQYFNPIAPLTFPIEYPYDQINYFINYYYKTQNPIQADSFVESFYTASTDTLQGAKEDYENTL